MIAIMLTYKYIRAAFIRLLSLHCGALVWYDVTPYALNVCSPWANETNKENIP